MQLRFGKQLENMESSHSVAQKNGNSRSAIPALSQPMVTLTLGMPTTKSMALVIVEQPLPTIPPLNPIRMYQL